MCTQIAVINLFSTIKGSVSSESHQFAEDGMFVAGPVCTIIEAQEHRLKIEETESVQYYPFIIEVVWDMIWKCHRA